MSNGKAGCVLPRSCSSKYYVLIGIPSAGGLTGAFCMGIFNFPKRESNQRLVSVVGIDVCKDMDAGAKTVTMTSVRKDTPPRLKLRLVRTLGLTESGQTQLTYRACVSP